MRVGAEVSVGEVVVATVDLGEKVGATVDVGEVAPAPAAISEMSDAEVLALSDLAMDPVQDRRLSELLDQQQAGTLGADERGELDALMQVYQEGLLRKAQALGEAVHRGLRAPLG